MHSTSYNAMQYLVHKLCERIGSTEFNVLDVGSQHVEGNLLSYRSIFESLHNARYSGLDMIAGQNVDVVAKDPYKFPLESNSFDLVISGQAFEHIEFPWLTIREIERVLRPGGFAIIIAPSSGPEHRYPNDCWRFYPDGMRALGKWASLDCIEASTNWLEARLFMWGDTIGVFQKPGGAPNVHGQLLMPDGSLRYGSHPRIAMSYLAFGNIIVRLYVWLGTFAKRLLD
jgi:SAM-dependent methyltransferase